MRTLTKTAAKDIALFMAAPIIGLAYAMLFPFVALGALVWFGAKALAEVKVARMIAAPFIGLAMVVLMPFAGIAALIWIACSRETPKATITTPYEPEFRMAA